jgi:hypothetical protein
MKVEEIKSIEDCNLFCAGVLNDLDAGIITKKKALLHLRDYTFHLHNMFSERINVLIEKNDLDIPKFANYEKR